MQPILYVHDLDGSPVDALAQKLRRSKAAVVAPDGRFRTLTARIAGVRAALSEHPGAVVVGQGFGALAACAAVVAEPRRVQALVLLSPALTWSEPSVFDADTVVLPVGLRVLVVHGAEDAVTPVSASRALVARFPSIELVVVDDVADLRGSLDDVVKRIRLLARTPAASPAPKAPVRKAAAAPKTPTTTKAPAVPKAPKARAAATRKKASSRTRERMPLVFAHDLDRGRTEAPVALLYRWNPVVPDGFGKGLARRVDDLQAALDESGPCIVGGAGYGAVAAMVVAVRSPRKVRGLLLLGPSLGVVEGEFDARRMTVPAGIPTTVVIGTRDLVSSLDDVLALRARCPHVQLVTPDDSHDLAASGPAVVGALQDLQLAQRAAAAAKA